MTTTPADGTPADTIPEWMAGVAKSARRTGLPSAVLADAMRNRGEDPRDETLWQARLDQLDIVLFGKPAREIRPYPGERQEPAS
jgi:hypothetical protein